MSWTCFDSGVLGFILCIVHAVHNVWGSLCPLILCATHHHSMSGFKTFHPKETNFQHLQTLFWDFFISGESNIISRNGHFGRWNCGFTHQISYVWKNIIVSQCLCDVFSPWKQISVWSHFQIWWKQHHKQKRTFW